MGMDQELFKFRAIIGHQGPLLASDPDWKGSKYNVQVEWETGEITFEPLSMKKYLQEPLSKVRLGKSGDPKLTCLVISSLETTWKPCNLTQKTKTANGMMPLSLRWNPWLNTKYSKSGIKQSLIHIRKSKTLLKVIKGSKFI